MRQIWEKSKNSIIKVTCYLIIICILLVCFNLNFHYLFKVKSTIATAQTSDELMSLVTADSYEILEEIERSKPATFGEFTSSEYPSSLNVLTTVDEEKRTAIYDENVAMYEDIELAIEENRLKKHNSADGQFYGTVSDEAPGIIKKTYVNALVKRKHSLGVYAPAGEVLTVEIDESMINKGLSIVIGYETSNNTIPLNRFLSGNQDRMPLITKSFNLTSTSTKIGTPLGGAVYVHVPDNVNDNFTITVSGGVDNPVFQLGVNTEEDLTNMLETPGLIMEFKLPHIRLIMPKSYVSIDNDPLKALELWHKMSSLSTYAMGREGNTLPIAHYYDSYIPAGAAVAYQWGWFSILPPSWGTSALNYDSLMYSGNWGNFHEFNHHYQSMNYSSGKWGLSDPSEVTNNVLTTLGYLLYTDIASTRSETQAPGNGGWNISTDPYYNLKNVLNISSNITDFSEMGTNQLYMYAELMHAFGTEKFMNFIRASYGLYENYEKDLMNDVDSFAIRASKIFESDLTYFFTTICKMNLKEETKTEIKNLNYEPYLPLYNLYSKGIQGIDTGRVYYLNNSSHTFDFNKYTVTPLEYEIKEVSKATYGKLKRNADGTYSYKNNNYKKDSFTITYAIKYEGKEYLETLDFEIDFSFAMANVKTYSTDKTTINKAIININEDNLITNKYVNSLNYDVDSGTNISIARGQIKVDKSGNYTFAVYGDDKIKLNLNGKDASTDTYTSNINLDNQSSYFTTYLEGNKFYDYTLYCLNTGGAGSAKVKYSYENEKNFIDISNNYVYSELANKENSIKKYNNYNIVYDVKSDLISKKYSGSLVNKIESIETTANAHDTSSVSSMFDGDKNTSFHTAWQSNITEFPHTYIIKFDGTATFNSVNIYFTNNSLEYAIGQYEIYTSNDNKEYTLLGKNTNDKTTLNIKLDKVYKAKYLKLVVKSNVNNKLFTSISEIEVVNQVDMNDLNYYASNNDKLHYRENWNVETLNNHFNNIRVVSSKESRLEFKFEGTQIALYTSANSSYKIKIDNGKWVKVEGNNNEFSPSYLNLNLKNKEHKVVIEALNDSTGIEMIGVNGKLIDQNIYSQSFIELYKIIASVAISIVLVQGSLFLYNKRKVIKDKLKGTFTTLKEKIIKA